MQETQYMNLKFTLFEMKYNNTEILDEHTSSKSNDDHYLLQIAAKILCAVSTSMVFSIPDLINEVAASILESTGQGTTWCITYSSTLFGGLLTRVDFRCVGTGFGNDGSGTVEVWLSTSGSQLLSASSDLTSSAWLVCSKPVVTSPSACLSSALSFWTVATASLSSTSRYYTFSAVSSNSDPSSPILTSDLTSTGNSNSSSAATSSSFSASSSSLSLLVAIWLWTSPLKKVLPTNSSPSSLSVSSSTATSPFSSCWLLLWPYHHLQPPHYLCPGSPPKLLSFYVGSSPSLLILPYTQACLFWAGPLLYTYLSQIHPQSWVIRQMPFLLPTLDLR